MKYPPRSIGYGRPVFGLDVDGTLGDYHEHFTTFAEAWLGRQLPRDYAGGSFASHLGMSKATYRQIKLAYRRGGLKRSMPAYEGAADLAASLRKRGAVVIICTTRPYLSMDNIEPDTREWLRRNRIQHDGVIAGENKYRDLKAVYGKEAVVSVLEDLPDLLSQAEACGFEWVMPVRKYNVSKQLNDFGCYVSDLHVAQRVLLNRLNEWEARQ